MPYALGILTVTDFAAWKAAHDTEDGAAVRKAAGMKAYQIFQSQDEPNTVVHLSQWDSMDAARKFLQSDELKKANEQSGVTGMDSVHFIEEMDRKSV